MGVHRTCGEPDEIKKIPTRKILPLFFAIRPGTAWTTIEKTAYYSLAARKNYGRMVYAAGWDSKSAILRVKDQGSPDAPSVTGGEGWTKLRLPKASHAFDHGWQTEWPRIREVETERYLLDHQVTFAPLAAAPG